MTFLEHELRARRYFLSLPLLGHSQSVLLQHFLAARQKLKEPKRLPVKLRLLAIANWEKECEQWHIEYDRSKA